VNLFVLASHSDMHVVGLAMKGSPGVFDFHLRLIRQDVDIVRE
jgi:hypothetical protein